MISLAAPDYFITVGGFTGERQEDLKTRRKLLRRLRTLVGEVHLVSAIEPNPQWTGYHLHAWGYGDLLEEWQLTEAAQRAGLGTITHLEPVTYDGYFDYIVKNATWNQRSLAEHIRINGTELVQGRGFWRDSRTGQHMDQEQARAVVRNLNTTCRTDASEATKAAQWSGKHLHAVGPALADRVRDERPFTYVDRASGEVLASMAARASLEALSRPGLVGAIVLTFRDSEGGLRLLDGQRSGGVPAIKVLA